MRKTLATRLWLGPAAIVALLLGGSLWSPAQPPGAKDDTVYYRRVKIDTTASHAAEDANVKRHIDEHFAVREPTPGVVEAKILEGKGLNNAGATWTVRPAEGKASWHQL